MIMSVANAAAFNTGRTAAPNMCTKIWGIGISESQE